MVQEPIQKGCGDDRAAEDFSPFCKTAIGGEDPRALFVARVHELEKEIAATGDDRKVPDFVDDQQRGSAVEPDLFTQRPFTFGLG